MSNRLLLPNKTFFEWRNIYTGECLGHVDTYTPTERDMTNGEKNSDCYSTQSMKLKDLIDEVEDLIKDEEECDYIEAQIAIIDRRYENIKNYWRKKIKRYS